MPALKPKATHAMMNTAAKWNAVEQLATCARSRRHHHTCRCLLQRLPMAALIAVLTLLLKACTASRLQRRDAIRCASHGVASVFAWVTAMGQMLVASTNSVRI
jgi:hypothetical protein